MSEQTIFDDAPPNLDESSVEQAELNPAWQDPVPNAFRDSPARLASPDAPSHVSDSMPDLWLECDLPLKLFTEYVRNIYLTNVPWSAAVPVNSSRYTTFLQDVASGEVVSPPFSVIDMNDVRLADAQGRPQFLSRRGSGTLEIIQDATSFSSWYRDTAFSKKLVSKLLLTRDAGTGSYGFDSASFFPLDAAPGVWPERQADSANVQRNFLFTSELRIPFKYKGGENLTFRGDDDVWVFVNGKLAVDLGGVKNSRTAAVTLDGAVAAQLGLTVGGMYEFVVFQAERNPTLSSYRLTLNDFDRILTTCKSVCGDGIKTPDEVCDDGKANNTGAYGKCQSDCSARGPFCGDGIVQAAQGEQCDATPGCSADCRLAGNAPK